MMFKWYGTVEQRNFLKNIWIKLQGAFGKYWNGGATKFKKYLDKIEKRLW